MDVKNAFMYSDLKVSMEKPSWYVAQGENMVCKLKKVIYGLNQNP